MSDEKPEKPAAARPETEEERLLRHIAMEDANPGAYTTGGKKRDMQDEVAENTLRTGVHPVVAAPTRYEYKVEDHQVYLDSLDSTNRSNGDTKYEMDYASNRSAEGWELVSVGIGTDHRHADQTVARYYWRRPVAK